MPSQAVPCLCESFRTYTHFYLTRLRGAMSALIDGLIFRAAAVHTLLVCSERQEKDND